jgi:hypothetical protein
VAPTALFNSPQKQWVREHFWLPILLSLKERSTTHLRYLTFAGPEGFDIQYFVEQGIFDLEHVRVWERSQPAATALLTKFGVNFQVKVGEAYTLAKAHNERDFFPHHVINLDFTNGAFQVSRPRALPTSFEITENLIAAQREHATSFVLLLAFAANADVDSEIGKAFVQKTAFDLATRFGHTEPLFDLTRDPVKMHAKVLSSVIPCAVIRQGGEAFYDVQCLGKALYTPNNSKVTSMLCLAFEFTYDYPAMSETLLQTSTRFDEIVVARQKESLALPLQDVNRLLKQSRPRARRR